MEREAPTVEELGQFAEIQEQMAEVTEGLVADVTQQTSFREKPKRSMITYQGQTIPDRFKAWRSDDGTEVTLPTGLMGLMLRKRHANGKPVFLTKNPGIVKPEIPETCDICTQNRGGLKKKFISRMSLMLHMRHKHPMEEQMTREEREYMDRQEERALMRQMIQRGGANGNSEEVPTTHTCETCGKGFSKKVALVGHRRTHQSA